MMKYILDIAILVILLIFILRGRSKGFVLNLASFAVVIAAFVGAGFVTTGFSPLVAERIEPHIYGAVYDAVDISGAVPEDFKLYGMSLNGAAEKSGEFIGQMGDAAVSKAAKALAGSASVVLVSVISFAVILLVLKLAARILNLATKLPVLNFLNKTLGMIFGGFVGLVVVFFLVKISSSLTAVIPPEVAEQTVIYKFLSQYDLFSGL
ncbi:MAG: CvpA family protein [Oscillospiraceae bacterium]|jgi:uncharacterized membrane protein required for colicin V production|nr:CvpA family protein [Oscillospiraceae bacterium]